jgi:two-component SAPR family response regulator
VVGPFSRLSEAMVAAVHEEIDAGIIDVNLGGEFVYPVADVLVARALPFVFVTGYGVESIDARFGFVPIVKKPVQRQALQRIFIPVNGEQGARLANRRNGIERVRRTASALQP